MTAPNWVENCCQAPVMPRLPGSAYSTRKAAAPPHSPPVEKPCPQRQISSRIGAPGTDGGVGRDQAGQPGRGRHQGDGDHQGITPSMPVAVAANDDGADGAHEERDAERCKSVDQRQRRMPAGKKAREMATAKKP